MQQLEFKLTAFEGPLDLMLHLISKHKLNINDIQITTLLEQYLDYIGDIQAADLEIATEFLTMAARLVYIKTVSLLPKPDDAQALKRELEGQLLEYHLAKLVAQQLTTLYKGGSLFIRKPEPITIDKTYKLCHESMDLLAAYLASVGKRERKLPPPRTAFTGIVSHRMVSVESRIIGVLRLLYTRGEVNYHDFFNAADRSELVATFLAMLELIKSKRISINEDNTVVTFNKNNVYTESELLEQELLDKTTTFSSYDTDSGHNITTNDENLGDLP